MKKIVACLVLITFVSSCIMPVPGFAQSMSALGMMSAPGERVSLSPAFSPARLKGMSIDPDSPFKFNFIVNRGDAPLEGDAAQAEYQKLIKYFLAALATPDTDQWVNLSPYEQDRIIPDSFGLTEMGRDLLAQDYLLKQLSASMMDPDTALGKKFWDGLYEEAYKRYGTTDIPTQIFNKIWITPDKAVLYEKDNTVLVVEEHLKVLTEADYLSMKNNEAEAAASAPDTAADMDEAAKLSLQMMREVIIPAIEKEVNEGRGFAPLRQVYSGMLLATWYKLRLKETILGKLYVDQGKVKGIDHDPAGNQQIYQQYVAAFQKGVVNLIKEDVDRYSQELIPRKYFSGGMNNTFKGVIEFLEQSGPAVKDIVAKTGENGVVVAIEFVFNGEEAAYTALVKDLKEKGAKTVEQIEGDSNRYKITFDAAQSSNFLLKAFTTLRNQWKYQKALALKRLLSLQFKTDKAIADADAKARIARAERAQAKRAKLEESRKERPVRNVAVNRPGLFFRMTANVSGYFNNLMTDYGAKKVLGVTAGFAGVIAGVALFAPAWALFTGALGTGYLVDLTTSRRSNVSLETLSPEAREAAIKDRFQDSVNRTLVWIGGTIVFGLGIGLFGGIDAIPATATTLAVPGVRGIDRMLTFFSAWLLEKSLSVDNLFAFMSIFSAWNMAKEPAKMKDILTKGVTFAVVTRVVLLLGGNYIVSMLKDPVVMTAFALWLGSIARKMMKGEEAEGEGAPKEETKITKVMNKIKQFSAGAVDKLGWNKDTVIRRGVDKLKKFRDNIKQFFMGALIKLGWDPDTEKPRAERIVKLLAKRAGYTYDETGSISEKAADKSLYFKKVDGKKVMTRAAIVLAIVEITDILFSADSIPSVVTFVNGDNFILVTSNLFAIMGLRSLFFVLQGLQDKFKHLSKGVALVLIFVALKMLGGLVGIHIPAPLSLSVMMSILGASMEVSRGKSVIRGVIQRIFPKFYKENFPGDNEKANDTSTGQAGFEGKAGSDQGAAGKPQVQRPATAKEQIPVMEDGLVDHGQRTTKIHAAPASQKQALKGGIDFAQSNLDMQIKRDGAGVVLPVNQQDLDSVTLDGLVPVILDIKSAAEAPVFQKILAGSAA